MHPLGTTETFILVMGIIFTLPYLAWRLLGRDRIAPLVVVQIIAGILLGPGVLGRLQPEFHQLIFTADVVRALNGISLWAVTLFVFLAGIELDFIDAWRRRRDSLVTAGFALVTPLVAGLGVACLLLAQGGWIGQKAAPWQFAAAVGMAAAVTALPVLLVLMERLDILRAPLGQRALRYASLDDIAIWGVLAVILLDWTRIAYQAAFLLAFAVLALGIRALMRRLHESDRWFVSLIWLCASALGADLAGLHFMVGAFLAGAVLDSAWFDCDALDFTRRTVLLALMPVFFLAVGLRTQWALGGVAVFTAALSLLAASVAAKLAGVHLAARVLRWPPGEANVIGWLLQTKGTVMIVFASVLIDKQLIAGDMFTVLLLVAIGSTMLTLPTVSRALVRRPQIITREG